MNQRNMRLQLSQDQQAQRHLSSHKESCQSVPPKMLILSTSLGCVVCMQYVLQTRNALVTDAEVCVVCLQAASIKRQGKMVNHAKFQAETAQVPTEQAQHKEG
jgi:hypothetical protein